MSAADEELVELFGERGIRYWTSDGQAVRLELRGQVAACRITASVEPETDTFQVIGHSPLLVLEGCRPACGIDHRPCQVGIATGQVRGGFRRWRSTFSRGPDPRRRSCVDYAAIDRMIGVNLSIQDTYQPAQLSVICANGVGVPKWAFPRMEAGMGQNRMTASFVFFAPYLRLSGSLGWSKGIAHH